MLYCNVILSNPAHVGGRYNQLIGKCGPYWEDAEGLLARLRDEGCVRARTCALARARVYMRALYVCVRACAHDRV